MKNPSNTRGPSFLFFCVIAIVLIIVAVHWMPGNRAASLQAAPQPERPDWPELPNDRWSHPWFNTLARLLKNPGTPVDELLRQLGVSVGKAEEHLPPEVPGIGAPTLKKEFSRILAGGIKNRYYEFLLPEDRYFAQYTLALMISNDTVIAASVGNGMERGIITFIDTVRLRAAVSEHEKLYGTEIDFSDRRMLPLDLGVYGSWCGRGAGMVRPVKLSPVAEMIRNNDIAAIRRWSRSMNPEIQAYGASGLYYLKSKGTILAEEDERVLALLRNSEIGVWSCQGCFVGFHRTMKEIFSGGELQSVAEKFEWELEPQGS